MNEKEINEDFDREYERYSREHKEGFVKMPTYYIAKHSDEDLRAAVLAEREACAKLCEERERANLYGVKECATAIRGRTE
jgi:hypothetical protein